MVTYLLCCVHVSPTKVAVFDSTGILLSIKCKLEYMVNYYSKHCSMKLDNTKLSLLITTLHTLQHTVVLFCSLSSPDSSSDSTIGRPTSSS